MSPMGWKGTWLSFASSPCTDGSEGPQAAPTQLLLLTEIGGLWSKFCNFKVWDCLPALTEDTNLYNGKLEIRNSVPCFLQHVFAQSLINLLIFFLKVFFFSFGNILSQYFSNSKTECFCTLSVFLFCFDGITSTFQRANFFFLNLKKKI